MNNLQTKETLTLDSREVAEMVEKRHDHLIRDIETYIKYLENPDLGNGSKPMVTDFFIKSSYASGTPQRSYKKYDITKKGCEFIAHKLTGQKGALFTATYINRFHEMEKALKEEKPKTIDNDAKLRNAEARLNNSKARQAKLLLQIAKTVDVPEYKQILNSKATEIITGEQLLPLPKTEKTYTAGDIAKEVGVSANMVGRTANKHNLKTDKYGLLVWDKSPHSNKQVESWRYNERGRKKLIEIFGGI